MRLRLVHTLSLLLAAIIFSSVLALGGLLAWNLRAGFNDYLAARDEERLGRFAAFLGERLTAAGGASALTSGRFDLRELLAEFAVRQGVSPGPPMPMGGPPPYRVADPLPAGPPPGFAPPAPPGSFAPPPGAGNFGAGLGVYAPDGRLLFGAPLGAAPRAVIAQPVRVAGAVVASVRMPASARVPDAVERAFLQRQYLGIAVVAVGLLVLGVIAARWIAGRWVNPLLSIQAATARIARGEFSVRLGEERSDEIGDLVRDLNRMAAGLQRLEVSRRRWIAEISHELRTPLTVLRGELDALEDGIRPFGAAALASLREEALRLSAIVDDLHLLAMADLEALPVHPVADDATRIVARVRERFALRAADRGLALELEAPPEGSLNVRWDGPRIEQLLGNLLENSLRYTDAPGTIRLTVAPNADTIDLDVDDSPPGVPSAALERLFEPLYRLDAARSRERGGSGLGLAICRALARAHGGEIQALASPLGGLRVRVRLPLPTVATRAEPRPA